MLALQNASHLGETMDQRKFTFYHADRGRLLSEGMELTAFENGLSRAGIGIHEGDSETTTRERLWETVRRQHFPYESSRFASFFAANSIADAEKFARGIVPVPEHDIPIWEIFASNCSSHDMNWRDYVQSDPVTEAERAHCYWNRQLTNHCPQDGERSPPLIEVKIGLPATVGRLVSWVKLNDK